MSMMRALNRWRSERVRRREFERAERHIAFLGYDRPIADRLANARALAESGLVPVRPDPRASRHEERIAS